MIELLIDKDSGVRWWGANVIGQIGGEKAVEPLKNALKDEGEYIAWKVKDRAFDSLEKISKKHKIRIH